MVHLGRPLLFAGAFSALLATCSALIPNIGGSVGIGLGVNVNGIPQLGKEPYCDPTELTCMCGTAGREIYITVPQCSTPHRWKTKCKPCDKMDSRDICPRFRNCAQCHLNGGDQCVSCPARRFGNWCENECFCENGAECDRNGKCLCPPEFEGQRCERRRRRGCPETPMAAPPLQETRQPAEDPIAILYSCPADYELSGSPVITCFQDGRWSDAPPRCLRKCMLLSSPANGLLEYTSDELVEGTSAIIRCNEGFQLIGQPTIQCLAGGSWSSALPTCRQISSCPDPGSASHSTRQVESQNALRNGPFLEGTKIRYVCLDDYEQMGAHTIICLSSKRWSDEPGTCLKISPVVADCKTRGEDIIAEIGVPVRLLCPPECANGIPDLWGTSIYKKDSAVCPAAVHSGIVTNSGGLVDVINNGEYSHYVGSNLNNVQSQSFDEREESFRFSRVPALVISKESGDCPKRLVRLQDMMCVHVSDSKRTEAEAVAICRNIGLRLYYPDSEEQQKSLYPLLQDKGITRIWTGKSLQSGGDCETATIAEAEVYTKESTNCRLKESFVCIYGSSARALASCEDQGPLTNGKATPVGKIGDVFYVGASVEYSCDSLHYMKGESVTFCNSNGTWSAQKPTCTRVNTCEEPPVPIGGMVSYLPPLRSSGSQRSADVRTAISTSRMARYSTGAEVPVPAARTAEDEEKMENIVLPPGVHKVGTRAMYDCESRYYQLVGSRTRRCETRGMWSGRPPTCMPVCGRSDSPRSPFIVNGNASDIGQWPWQAAVARSTQNYNNPWFVVCGGSLLNERWVITAAHCVTYAASTLPIDPDKFQIYLGKYHLKDTKDDEYVQVKKVHEIHIHPDYDPTLFDADIALLQLETAAQLNTRVQPVCLPSEQTARENLKDGRNGVVTGWGLNENETYSETLQQAVLPVVAHSACEKGYRDSKLPLTITENMYCAGFAQGRTDTCSGDSGGPMVFLDESGKEKRWVLEGIVSWGSPNGCGHANQYGGFTTVNKFLDWIHLFF